MAFGSTNMTGQHKNTHKTGGVDAIAPADIGAAPESHTHDGRYYTKDEINTKLNGKAASNHGTHVSYSVAAPVMDGTATAGSASTVARSDHRHPTDTSRAAASHTHDDRYVRLCTILLPKGRRIGDVNGDGKVTAADVDLMGEKYFGQRLSEYVPENEEDQIAILAADISESGDINGVDTSEMLSAMNKESLSSKDVLGVWKTREDLPDTDDGLTYIFYLDFPVSGMTEQDTAFLLASGSTFFRGDVVCLNGKIQVRCMAPPPDDLPALVVFYRSLVTHL